MSQFNPLNGEELIDVMLAKAKEALILSGEFPTGLTFPWVKFDFKFNVVSYPKQPMEDEIGIVTKGEGEVIVPGTEPEGDPVKVGLATAMSIVIDTPDQARVDAGIGIPTVVPGLGGVLVDEPVQPKGPPIKKK